MNQWTAIGLESLLDEGAFTEVKIDNQRILLARVSGDYYAIQAFCSHMGGEFKKGGLEGYVVSCPRNRSRFDVRDGSVVTWLERLPGGFRAVAEKFQHPCGLRVYPVRVESGQIWLDIQANGGKQ